jgi:hypothetical protein
MTAAGFGRPQEKNKLISRQNPRALRVFGAGRGDAPFISSLNGAPSPMVRLIALLYGLLWLRVVV